MHQRQKFLHPHPQQTLGHDPPSAYTHHRQLTPHRKRSNPHSPSHPLTSVSTPSRFPPLRIVQRPPAKPLPVRLSLRIGVGVEQSLTTAAIRAELSIFYIADTNWNDLRGTEGIASEPHRHSVRKLQLPLDRLEARLVVPVDKCRGSATATDSVRHSGRFILRRKDL